MQLLFFKLKLAFHLGVFTLTLFANYSNKIKPIILSVFVVGLFMLIGGISLLTRPEKETIIVSTVVPQNTSLYSQKTLTQEEIESEILFWEHILKIQPKSRDVLINLSHLYSALEVEEKATEYRNSALFIDPNNPLFEY